MHVVRRTVFHLLFEWEKLEMRIASALILVACTVLGSRLSAQELTDLPKPLKEHEVLKKGVGTWDADISIFSAPDAPPEKSKGVEKVTMLGEFWTITHFEYDFMGEQVAGHGVIGYDPDQKKYVGTWHESATPWRSQMEGSYNEKEDQLTFMMKGKSMDGKNDQMYKIVMGYPDAQHRTFEMSIPIPGQDGFVRILEIKYTKR